MQTFCSICGHTLTTTDIAYGICVGCRNVLACAPPTPPKLSSALEDKIKELERRLQILEEQRKQNYY